MKYRQKTLLWIFSLLLLIGCGTSSKTATEHAADKTVVIFAVNDMHAALDNFPHFAFMVDKLRDTYPDMLLVSGGDNQTGNPVNDQYPEKGIPMIDLMNALKFDLSAMGNHEFDLSLKGMRTAISKANFDFISGNIILPPNERVNIKPYKIISMPNGVKVAFASVLHINSMGIPDVHPNNIKGIRFEDPNQAAKKYLFLKESCDILVFINHLGFENDVKLAKELPAGKVDLIIGAHSHTKVDKDQIHNGTMITQAESKLKYATLIKLTVRPNGSVEKKMQLLTVGKKGNEKAGVRAMVNKFNNNPAMNAVIAQAEDDFVEKEQIGNLTADALRAETQSDLAFINAGGVRISQLSRGGVSVKDVYTIDPFGNEIVIFKLSGEEVLDLHKAAYDADDYHFLYPSGLKSSYVVGKNKKLVDVKLFSMNDKPFDLNKSYTVAMNSYMAVAIKFKHRDTGRGLFKPSAESMIDYLRKLKKIPSYKSEKRVEVKDKK